jgi:hypothetical protein
MHAQLYVPFTWLFSYETYVLFPGPLKLAQSLPHIHCGRLGAECLCYAVEFYEASTALSGGSNEIVDFVFMDTPGRNPSTSSYVRALLLHHSGD